MYKYTLEKHPSPKITCPKCGTAKVFRCFQGIDRSFGICDRVNECGARLIPTTEIVPQIEENKVAQEKITLVYPSDKFCQTTIKNFSSNFHTFCIKTLKITKEHLEKWNCGTIEDKTAFVYKNKGGKYFNIVHIDYSENGKRNKEKMPYSLSAKRGTKYPLCLFGEHLLRDDKIICLVESEKTAIIASSVYTEFDWLATGGANKLTDEKIDVLFGRKIYYLSDADIAGRENSTIKKLIAYELDYKNIHLFPEKSDGYDIADAIIDGLKPEIKTSNTSEQEIPAIQKSKNISDFEKVENYLSDRYEIRFNEVANEIEFRHKGATSGFEVLNENNIYIELQKAFINFSQAKLTALLRSSFVTFYDPFKDYFENLETYSTNEPDYILNVCKYLPIREDDKERFNNQFKKMLVRCIACALIPGVFNKQAFIIVHDQQNSGKSTFCRWLNPPALSDYITENISTDKDSLICLSDNFIINMDELATLNKAEINTLKAMMSKDVVKIRRPYDKKPILTPRRASFVGSTNKSEFLSDETGSVRWICFELINRIDFNYKKDIDINNVWKQAYSLYKQGFKYELTPEEIEENEKANRAYQITTEEQELIQKCYSPATKETHNVFYQATDIKSALLEKFPHARLNNITIGRALKILGFKQEQQMKENLGYQIKGYYINFINSET